MFHSFIHSFTVMSFIKFRWSLALCVHMHMNNIKFNFQFKFWIKSGERHSHNMMYWWLLHINRSTWMLVKRTMCCNHLESRVSFHVHVMRLMVFHRWYKECATLPFCMIKIYICVCTVHIAHVYINRALKFVDSCIRKNLSTRQYTYI